MSIGERELRSVNGRRWSARTAAVLGFLVVGCLVVPIPTPRHGESVITPETLAGFEEGRTTRMDVLLTLGDPLERYAEDRFFVYAWNETHGYLLWGVGGQGGGAGGAAPMEDTHRLILDFAPDGVLTRKASLDSSLWKKRSEADAWVQRWMDEAEAREP
jgi:outer membrane protein assembly factor BamE (lipoprotein component of BamABCDE complex)